MNLNQPFNYSHTAVLANNITLDNLGQFTDIKPRFMPGDAVRVRGNGASRKFIVKHIIDYTINTQQYCYRLIVDDVDGVLMQEKDLEYYYMELATL